MDNLATRFRNWVSSAASNQAIARQQLDPATAKFAKQLEAAIAAGYRVEHRVLDVSIPPPTASGSTTMTLSTWPRPSYITGPPGRP